jgi:hypothetical protein
LACYAEKGKGMRKKDRNRGKWFIKIYLLNTWTKKGGSQWQEEGTLTKHRLLLFVLTTIHRCHQQVRPPTDFFRANADFGSPELKLKKWKSHSVSFIHYPLLDCVCV